MTARALSYSSAHTKNTDIELHTQIVTIANTLSDDARTVFVSCWVSNRLSYVLELAREISSASYNDQVTLDKIERLAQDSDTHTVNSLMDRIHVISSMWNSAPPVDVTDHTMMLNLIADLERIESLETAISKLIGR